MAYKGKKLADLTPKARAKRIAALAANPATRAAIPDQYLPAKYKAGRAYASQKKTPAKLPEVAPGLTQADLDRRVRQGTAVEFGPQERQLQAQAPRIADWYKQYVDAINSAGTRQQGVATQAVTGLQNLQSGLDTAAAKQWAGQQQAMAADAQVRGASTDPGLADVVHNASNVRNALTGGFGAMLLNQGLTEQNYLANRGTVATQQGIEALSANAGKLGEIAKQKGAYAATLGDKLVAQANQAANDASTRALNDYIRKSQLAQGDARIQQGDKRIKISEKQQKSTASHWASTVNKYGVTQGAWRDWGKTPAGQAKRDAAIKEYNRVTHPPKQPKDTKTTPKSGPGSLSPAAEQKRIERVRKISGLFANGVTTQSVDANGKVVTTVVAKPGDVVAVKNYLRAQQVDPLAIEIGESLYHNGGDTLGPYGLSRAHKYGIHVGGNFRVTKGPGKQRRT